MFVICFSAIKVIFRYMSTGSSKQANYYIRQILANGGIFLLDEPLKKILNQPALFGGVN